MQDQDSARKGKAVEHLVAATCILTSRLTVQVKSRSTATKAISERNRFYATVRSTTFRSRRDLWLLFVPVDADEGTFAFVWFVPSERLAEQPVNGRGRRVFAASTKDGSQDQWSEYRVERSGLADAIIDALEELGPR